LEVPGAAPTVFDLLSGAFLVVRILNDKPDQFTVHPATLTIDNETIPGVINKFVVQDDNRWPSDGNMPVSSSRMYTARVLPGLSALDANKAFIGMIVSIMKPVAASVKNGGARGGKARKSSAKTKAKKSKSGKAENKWESTGRQITTKSGAKKTVYTNRATGEQRVRNMVVDKKTGAKKARYVKF
jgi:hypothetical protein